MLTVTGAAGGACPGGDQVQRIAALPPVVAATRGLPIDGDDIGVTVAQAADPGLEAGLEQLRVQVGMPLS